MNQQEEMIQPDPTLGATLRWMDGEPPVHEVDWDRLRATVRARAELPLARRRSSLSRVRGWARPLVPLAAAAGVALAMWTGDRIGQKEAGAPMAEGVIAAPPVITAEEAFQADLSDQEFQQVVSGRHNPDALLLLAIQDG